MTRRVFRPAEFGIYMASRAKTGPISSLIAMESGERHTRARCQKLVLVNDAKTPLAGKQEQGEIRDANTHLQQCRCEIKSFFSPRKKFDILFRRRRDDMQMKKTKWKEDTTFNRGA